MNEIRQSLQLLSNSGLNILLAEKFYGFKVICRTTFPKNRVKYYYNIQVHAPKRGEIVEEPLPNYVKETKKLLADALKNGYNVFVEPHGRLFRAVVNGYDAVDDFERSIAIALLLNILLKEK